MFRAGLVLKAHVLLYHSTLGSRVTNKKKRLVETLYPEQAETQTLKLAASEGALSEVVTETLSNNRNPIRLQTTYPITEIMSDNRNLIR